MGKPSFSTLVAFQVILVYAVNRSEERVSIFAEARRWKVIRSFERKCSRREAFKMVEIINWGFLELFAYNGLVAQSVASLLPVKLVQDDPGSNPVDGREEE